MRAASRAVVPIAAAIGGYVALYRLGLVSGSSPAERTSRLPGDELISSPSLVTNHAATLPATPEQVWPWMTQIGWHRAGWYTPHWVDALLFPGNGKSADRLDPLLVRDLKPGDTIPDGPPGRAQFVVELADAPRTLVLHSRTHLPPGWAERFGAELDWVWTFSFTAAAGGRTRMLIRNRGFVKPAWLDLAYRAFIVPADHIMATGMFDGLTRRLEGQQEAARS